MNDLLLWLARMENSKVLALVLFFVTFCLIVLYVFTGKRRARRLEAYKYIPFQEKDEHDESEGRKVTQDERSER